MMTLRSRGWIMVGLAVVGVSAGCSEADSRPLGARDYISGQVVSEDGPEAGVWVIAQSDQVMPNDGRVADFFRKIVVTDDQGRFVVPDLPDAEYDVWVRGYGLVDSKPTWSSPPTLLARPGDRDVRIDVQKAATPAEAAKVYPSNYWFSLLELPSDEEIQTHEEGYYAPGVTSQAVFQAQLKLQCVQCHQLGAATTRFTNRHAYEVGIKKAAFMLPRASQIGFEALVDALGAWGSKIHAGAVPPMPPRPQGAERNVVITQWEFGTTLTYTHDASSVDRLDPTSNPYGPIFAPDIQDDWLYAVYPAENRWERQRIQIHPDAEFGQDYFGMGSPAPDGHSTFRDYTGWSAAHAHCPTVGPDGRVWLTTGGGAVRGVEPGWCDGNVNSLTAYDPETGEFEVIPACFSVHHLKFDSQGRVWSCGLGWFDQSLYDRNDPATLERAQGQAVHMVDSDGDGVADTRVPGGGYAIDPSPDGSVWQSIVGPPGRINRWDPATNTMESYAPPYGSGPRGISVDSNGVVWTALAGSGHLARFDRSKCAQTWGTGDQCPEGWTLWKTPGPTFQGFEPTRPEENASADMHYFIWVDRTGASGLGENTVFVNGTGSDSLIIFDQETEQFIQVRVPYPLGYYTRGSDARIDDPDAGWKGRGVWTTINSATQLFTETKRNVMIQMQFRPDPLAF